MSHLLNTELLRCLSGGLSPESQKQQGMRTDQVPCDFYHHGHLGKAALETVYVPVSGLNSNPEHLPTLRLLESPESRVTVARGKGRCWSFAFLYYMRKTTALQEKDQPPHLPRDQWGPENG